MIEGADIYADFAGLERMRTEARKESPEALRAVAKQFEAFFLNLVLKSMRDASMGDSLFGSDQEKFYRQMFDQQLATTLSTKGMGVGLADMLVRQLGKHTAAGAESKPEGDEAPVKPAPFRLRSTSSPAGQVNPLPAARLQQAAREQGPLAPAPAAVSVPKAKAAASAAAVPELLDGTPQTFVQTLLPHAQRAAKALGVSPAVLLAQAALETGWGKSVIAAADGKSSHNLFGIKADAGWDGPSVSVPTLEYADGAAVKQQSAFRSYGSFADSFTDYVNFIKGNPRYTEALKHRQDPAAFSEALQRAGYATDPAYAEKIQAILDSGNLGEKLATVKNSADGSLT
jgi:flagellar protein FlgJ